MPTLVGRMIQIITTNKRPPFGSIDSLEVLMSSNETFRRPSFRSCLLGLVASSILSTAFWFVIWFALGAFHSFGDLLATPFMLVPDALGLIDEVSGKDVVAVTVPSEHEFELPRAGAYFIFSTNLLPADDRVLVRTRETSAPIEVPCILNGTNPYGSSVVEGTPVFEFKVDRAGTYELYLQNLPPNAKREYTLFVVPNVLAKNQAILAVSFLLHVGIVVLAVRQIYFWRNKDKIQQEKAAKDKKREKFDEWVRKQRQSQ